MRNGDIISISNPDMDTPFRPFGSAPAHINAPSFVPVSNNEDIATIFRQPLCYRNPNHRGNISGGHLADISCKHIIRDAIARVPIRTEPLNYLVLCDVFGHISNPASSLDSFQSS